MPKDSDKYARLTLNELKELLRKKGARISGRKADLIERLESYDRNADFGEEVQVCRYEMTLPHPSRYIDLHGDHRLPHLDNAVVDSYLLSFGKQRDSKPVMLYENRYLLYLRMCNEDGTFFFKASVRAEMKKNVIYMIDVSIAENGTIKETQCDCAAGMGPNGHCKHVSCVLHALVDFQSRRYILTEETCTQKTQAFNISSKYKGSPVKARDLKLKRTAATSCSADPRPQHLRNMAGYNDYVRNIVLNFPNSQKIPITQCYEPANLRAVWDDHDYLHQHSEDIFLDNLGVQNLTEEKRKKIEEMTRGQSSGKTGMWKWERLVRLQASNFGVICKATDRKDKVAYASQLTTPSNVSTAAIRHGQACEQAAIRAYEKAMKVNVEQSGIVVHKDIHYLGCSPDGVVNSQNKLVEIKCPFSARDKMITSDTVDFLEVRLGALCIKNTHNYLYQIQGQLLCTGRAVCDLVIFTYKDMKVITITRDEEFIAQMLPLLKNFYQNYFCKALLNTHAFNHYHKYSFSSGPY